MTMACSSGRMDGRKQGGLVNHFIVNLAEITSDMSAFNSGSVSNEVRVGEGGRQENVSQEPSMVQPL